jgi:hypothetical protein
MSYNSPFTGNVIQPVDVSYRSISLTANTQLDWPINGNATDNFAARIMQVTPSAGSLSLAMPPGNQVSVGQDALILNNGAYAFTVKTYGFAGTIVSIAPGEAKYIYLTSTSTTVGVWGVIAYGVGTSSPDANALAGLGLVASGTTLNQSHPSIGIVNGATFTSSQRAQVTLWSGGAGSVYLPSSVSIGNDWFTLFKNNSTGSVTVATTGSDLIDGAVTLTFAPQESAFIISTGSGYITIGYGQAANFQFTALVKPVTSGTYYLTTQDISSTIQEYTGSLSGNVVAVYPQVVNIYVISNQTTANGHTLTITTGAAGAASVVVPVNNQVTLICDGTNFLNANTVQVGTTAISLVNGTTANPALNFTSENNTGIYRPSAGQFGISILGSNVSTLDSAGLTIAGTGTFINGVFGGTF